MSDGKEAAASTETFAYAPICTRENAVASLLSLNSEKYVQETYDRKNTVRDSSCETCIGWDQIRSTCMYETKAIVKTKSKKIFGGCRNITTTTLNARNDRKKIKILFSNHLKYMFTDEKHEYIPSNGVYRLLKLAESNSDSPVHKKKLRKPGTLPPLNSDGLLEEMMCVPEIRNSGEAPCSDNDVGTFSNLLQLKDFASFAISDLSCLRIDGDHPHTINKRSGNKRVRSKSGSADDSLKVEDIENITDCSNQMHASDSNADLRKNANFTIDDLLTDKRRQPKPKEPKQPKNLPTVELKATTTNNAHRSQDVNLHTIDTLHRLPCVNIAQPFCSYGQQETFSLFKKDQKARKFNKGLIFHEICKTFTYNQAYGDYRFRLNSTINDTVQTTSGCLGEGFLPEILGKRIRICPTIHRWL